MRAGGGVRASRSSGSDTARGSGAEDGRARLLPCGPAACRRSRASRESRAAPPEPGRVRVSREAYRCVGTVVRCWLLPVTSGFSAGPHAPSAACRLAARTAATLAALRPVGPALAGRLNLPEYVIALRVAFRFGL